MEFTAPLLTPSVFTVYGKSACTYCGKVKALLTEYNQSFVYVDCDEYLVEQRDRFLEFIEKLAGKAHKTFPMVFSSGEFIGGYIDTLKLLTEKYE